MSQNGKEVHDKLIEMMSEIPYIKFNKKQTASIYTCSLFYFTHVFPTT